MYQILLHGLSAYIFYRIKTPLEIVPRYRWGYSFDCESLPTDLAKGERLQLNWLRHSYRVLWCVGDRNKSNLWVLF